MLWTIFPPLLLLFEELLLYIKYFFPFSKMYHHLRKNVVNHQHASQHNFFHSMIILRHYNIFIYIIYYVLKTIQTKMFMLILTSCVPIQFEA